MDISEIKRIAETYNIESLKEAEQAIYDDQPLTILINGIDEGEKLTHILAAIQIIESMQKQNIDFRTALRNYTQRVRKSIS